MKVFVSCTTRDLGRFRKVICDDPEQWWGSPRNVPQFHSMSDPKAEAIPPVDWSMREAATADAVVLLLGRCHGELAKDPVPENSGLNTRDLVALIEDAPEWQGVEEPARFSYTQWEVLAAMAAGVPVLAFSPDRDSTDEDLKPYWQMAAEEEPWLRRQECFANWVRSRLSEDHFASRADLLNRVRAALKRLQRRRRVWRGLILAAALVALVGAALFLADQGLRWADRRRQQAEQAARLERIKLQHKHAAAAGGSLAMLGQSSSSVGRTVFERALRDVGLPASEVGELHKRYAAMDDSARAGRLAYDQFQQGEAKLRNDVKAQIRVLAGDGVPPYVDFGHDLCYLELLLRHWDRLRAQGDLAATVEERLAALKRSAQGVDLPGDLAAALQGMTAAQLAQPASRQAAAEVLDRAISLYDMEPTDPERARKEP